MHTSSLFRAPFAPWMLPLMIVGALLFLPACGDDGLSPNERPPIVDNEIEDQRVKADDEPLTVDLNTVFRDSEGRSLSFDASSSDEDVATAAVSAATLTVTFVGGGSTEITATATNDDGSRGTSFMLEVDLPDPPTRPSAIHP
ncbi:MAG: hypothetical protein PPP56_01870 [Longimonas sp.]|uniref:hypothetical protein n=1 Tax=Longimonas sp. TaxID=2039626 RepID=UPI00334752AD